MLFWVWLALLWPSRTLFCLFVLLDSVGVVKFFIANEIFTCKEDSVGECQDTCRKKGSKGYEGGRIVFIFNKIFQQGGTTNILTHTFYN